MMEIELWDGTKARPRPIARLGVSKDNELVVLAGEGKVRLGKTSVGSGFEDDLKERHVIYITNLSMLVDLDADTDQGD